MGFLIDAVATWFGFLAFPRGNGERLERVVHKKIIWLSENDRSAG
jgi:hypothetical protein